MKKIAFFHGLESSSNSEKSRWLKDNYDTWAPDMNYEDPGLFDKIYKELLRFKPDLLIGSSMGGWFAYCLSSLTGIRTLLLNPAVHSRSYEPKVRTGKTPSIHTVLLGKTDSIILPDESKSWFIKNGLGEVNIKMENMGHRSPLSVLQNNMSKALNEEWTLETPGNEPDLSFLPEGLRDFAVPNPMASRPFQNTGIGMTVENEREIPLVKKEQMHLSDSDRTFILNSANSPYDIFYCWLVIRGESPKMRDLKEMWNNEKAIDLINKMKEFSKRKRPYWISSEIEAIPGTETDSYSYPSGHSILAWLMAKKLGEKYPHLQDGLNHLAYRIARSRIQAGVHFPSDVQPGNSIADWMLINKF